LNIGVASPSFSVWCGFFVNPDLPIALVVEYEKEAERAQPELVRIGFDQIVGFIAADDLEETLQITQIGARDLISSMEVPRRPLSNAPLTVVCGSGYRSSIAASLLESEGFDRLANVMGGMYAVRHAKRPRLPTMELADSAITWEI
jgi:hydroxyacylglutathione hydrolase